MIGVSSHENVAARESTISVFSGNNPTSEAASTVRPASSRSSVVSSAASC